MTKQKFKNNYNFAILSKILLSALVLALTACCHTPKKSEMEKDNDFGSFKVMTSYGKTTKNQTNNRFIQLSGQDAWEEISGDTEMYNKVMMGILSYKQEIYQTIENIYLSDVKMSIEWVTNNFTNEDGTINFIKINKYVSGGIKG
jgi:hypothetical protein